MHILEFEFHTAILDPATGLGVLSLPPPLTRAEGTTTSLWDIAEPRNFFRLEADEYLVITRQLALIGWGLPTDDSGMPAWFDAGVTDCCGRTMIVLHSSDAPDHHLVQELVESSNKIRAAATQACCTHLLRDLDQTG